MTRVCLNTEHSTSHSRLYPARWYAPAQDLFFRVAASGFVPARWFLPALPAEEDRTPVTGSISLEIVSHCWNYAHMALYQMSSLVLFPPEKASVVFTFFYSTEDADTVSLLRFFEKQQVPNVMWNPRAMPKEQLFRREIGRNRAALSTRADWVWFTDCDIVFHRGCLDGLAEALQGRRDALLFPREERTTELLDDTDPILRPASREWAVTDIDVRRFTPHVRDRAKGEHQIVHGDVARAVGYCDRIPSYQTPAEHWCKCRGDRAFRWLLRTPGIPIEVPAVYQIRHKSKGRYATRGPMARVRGALRQIQDRVRS